MYLTVRLFIAHAILTVCVARHHGHRGNGTQRGSRKEFVSHEHWWKDGNDWVTNGHHDDPNHDVTHHFHDHFHDHEYPHHGDQGEDELFNRPPFIHENEYHHPDNRQDSEFHHHSEEPYHHISELHHDDLPHGVEVHHGDLAHEYGIPHHVPTSEFHHADFHITNSHPGSELYLTNSGLHHDDNYAHHVDESDMMREAEHHLNEHEHVHEHEGETHGHAAMMEDAEHHACSNCDSNAECAKGLCVCKDGYFGDGHLCQLVKHEGHEIVVEHEVEPHEHGEHGHIVLVEPNHAIAKHEGHEIVVEHEAEPHEHGHGGHEIVVEHEVEPHEHGHVVLVEPHRADHHDLQEFHHLDEAHEPGMDESQMMRVAEHRVNEREKALERQGETHAHRHLMDEAEHRNHPSYEEIHHLVDPQEPADNPCMPNPCRHGGICHLFGDDSRCVCTNDRHGRYCDMERSILTDMDRHTPACHSNPCRNGGTCIDEYHGGYKCICRMGWIGSFCQYRENDDPCVPNPCHNHQNCIDYGDSFRCKCDDGWEDAPCEEGHNCGCEPAPEPVPTMGPTHRPSSTRPHTPSRTPPAKTTRRPPKTSPKPPANAPGAAVDSPCHPNPCQNGGTCHEFDGGHNYNCICAVGYDGTHCQEDICAGCHVFAFCPNGKCKCRHGYRGDGYDCYKDDNDPNAEDSPGQSDEPGVNNADTGSPSINITPEQGNYPQPGPPGSIYPPLRPAGVSPPLPIPGPPPRRRPQVHVVTATQVSPGSPNPIRLPATQVSPGSTQTIRVQANQGSPGSSYPIIRVPATQMSDGSTHTIHIPACSPGTKLC